MSVLNVGSLSDKATASLNTSEFIVEQGPLSVASVGSPLAEEPSSLNTREFTLEKGLINVACVGNPLVEAPALFSTAVFTLGQGLMSVGSVGNPSGKRTAPRPGLAPAAPYHHTEFFRLQRTPRFNARYRDLCTDLAGSSANLIPRVTAIRTSPDLQWLVRPTEVFLVAPSQKIPPPIRSSSGLDGGYPVKTMAGGRTQGVGRKGKVEQILTQVKESLSLEGISPV
ncbi:PREDICTED: uncharacterized protein LOC103072956 [Lipotes vexillifer]|uniref:Uncharacterized protein LOC103072956 n=1 Tax=Lipotes vexillifer TaxID=118797 RepID=A0A340X851_LIPVE|nr:PREDICTED: uncharacterized protein LOC103072956 [Lipotes vexillifer]